MRHTQWERFQNGEETDQVRPDILTSWRRSRLCGVDPRYVDLPRTEVDRESRFARVAVPVLSGMAELLSGTGTCLALTDPAGRVLWRWVSDPGLRDVLDRASVAEGFSFDEQYAGTNGLGTSLETGALVTVRGAEHFKQPFHGLTCAAAPVRHPLTRRVTGAVNLTCHARHANPLLEPTVAKLVDEVESALRAHAGSRERRLLAAFQDTVATRSGPVVALNADVLLTNRAAAVLTPDHQRWWARVLDVLDNGGPERLDELDGRRVDCIPVGEGAALAGVVLVLGRHAPARTGRTSTESAGQHARATIDRLLDRPTPVVVRGEPGTGKRHLLRAGLAARGCRPLVLDCAVESPRRLLATIDGAGRDTTVVLAHLQALTPAAVDLLAARLPAAPVRLAATVTTGEPGADGHLTRLLAAIGAVPVDLAPLRARPDEIDTLVGELTPAGRRWSATALAAVRGYRWPGNLAELALAVSAALAADSGAEIGVSALPATVRAAAGRHLGPLEHAEATVINEVLAACGGNKAAAARHLGISRPTLYAKLRAYRL